MVSHPESIAAILDLCKLQEFPKVAVLATKLKNIYRPIWLLNHQKTIHFSQKVGPRSGNSKPSSLTDYPWVSRILAISPGSRLGGTMLTDICESPGKLWSGQFFFFGARIPGSLLGQASLTTIKLYKWTPRPIITPNPLGCWPVSRPGWLRHSIKTTDRDQDILIVCCWRMNGFSILCCLSASRLLSATSCEANLASCCSK